MYVYIYIYIYIYIHIFVKELAGLTTSLRHSTFQAAGGGTHENT